jgi:hypothetical protein
MTLSYTWVKLALQGAGLVRKSGRRGVHRRRRPRRPLPGMLLHLDGSSHAWFGGGRRYDLLVVLDDASSEIYYAQLVEQESTRTVLAARRAVVEKKGLFCALYSDRASHFFETPQAGAKIDAHRLTQVGRALQQLGIRMIPAYSPQARGRSERNFGTWQGRLPQEITWWAGLMPRGSRCRKRRGGETRWKRRWLRPLGKRCAFPTFPPPRRRRGLSLDLESGHFTCYKNRTSSRANDSTIKNG